MTDPVEFSRKIFVSDVGSGKDIEIVATPQECQMLAGRFNIPGIDEVKIQVHVRPWHGKHGLALEGHFFAKLRQTCGVSLEEIETTCSDSFLVHLLSAEKIQKQQRTTQDENSEIVIDVDADEPPEELVDPVDLASYAAEFIALSIDPYPRKEGLEYESERDHGEPEDEEPVRENPFAALAQLKKKH